MLILKQSKTFGFSSIFLIAAIISACSSGKRISSLAAEKGVMDIRGWDFYKDGPISLNGEWEYYWHKLYNPNDFDSILPIKDGYIKVPGKWFKSTSDGTFLPLNGYMTYRLVVISDHLSEKLLVYTKRAPATACFIYINGQLVAENGVPGTTKEQSYPSGMLDSKPFNYLGDTLEIIIPISNFHSGFDAGLFYELKIGDSKFLSKYRETELRRYNFMAGVYFVLVLYNLFVFFFLPENKASLYFSLFTICSLVGSISQMGIIFRIFLFNPYLYKPIETLFVYLFFTTGLTLFAYIYALYYDNPGQVKLEKYYASYAIVVLLFLLPWQCGIINNLHYGILIMDVFTFLLLVFYISPLYLLIIATIRKKDYAIHNAITVFLITIGIVIWAIKKGSLKWEMSYNIVLFVFMAVQTYIISARFVKTYHINVELKNGLLQINENLHSLVKERTHQLEEQKEELLLQKEELNFTLENLQKTQEQLIESAKMAAVGGLVTGVAHEINTPVGVGITAISNLLEDIQKMAKLYEKDEISRKDFKGFLESTHDTAKLIHKNLERTAELIQSFKQVSTDQVTEQQRVFGLKEYFNDILLSLRPKFREKKIEIKIQCDDELQLNSYPGVYAQIFTNLLLNSLQHGFYKKDTGTIGIKAEIKDKLLKIHYTDDGTGISKKDLPHIFEPFYTSDQRRGTGLGLNIIYNLVKQKLHGTITCESEPAKGVLFTIEVPV
jgi:signal transduction histidine kinase